MVTQHNPDILPAIVDTGANYSIFNSFQYVDPSSIRRLSSPVNVGGISGGLEVWFVGTTNCETVDEDGNVIPIQEQVLINEQLPFPILSPQAFLSHKANGGQGSLPTADFTELQHDSGDLQEHFRVFHDRTEWHMQGRRILTMNYDDNYLPRLTLFRKGTALPTLTALNAVLSPTNRNLSDIKKTWLRWHIKLGHLSFSRVQQMAIGGLLDLVALGLNKTRVGDPPPCASCAQGRQTRTPDKTTITKKVAESVGALKEGILRPGQRVFCDQLESRILGRLLHTAGREQDKDKYKGTTLFCDGASGYIHVEHQVSFSAADTIMALESFEREASRMGVTIDSYLSDNGIFKSRAFVDKIASNQQSIRFSGVGAKWQNGVSEGAINFIASTARTMMIHAALHWPEQDDPSLWCLAVSHAVHLYNHTPNRESGIAPIEIFTTSKNDGQALVNAHTWGCPCYILEPKLTQAGGKIPRWQPRSKRGQYLGVSPVHASNIALVRNLTTGYLSPCYHLIFDDWFETVDSTEAEPPPNWEHLCSFQKFQTIFDDDATPPMLDDEWLTEEEKSEKRVILHRQSLR